ncbi:MAG: cytochrome d ubiquinol oxidase subunit II [Alphaproteobacteria bacterium]|nr:cytochrome d ubiquinol oxidase subunit II [Alphaproteobacteria bacterium]MBU0798165.1 cytochrome d ubiquinol oxidase subunit II [Alphaproteobacteria bacterium]MBU0887616.1 cytochrome d ubiquinol oxidase subunit II [Alphaproteobacteria bacterium]MBU1814268.1 cytochrome d ubiquinol oxidase subunit II [Alphaproteobacteria bacterium]
MEIDLAFIWAGLIAIAVLAYVILDGFDLGVGILFPLYPEEHQRDLMMNTVAPVWDGNETWLVLGGGGLFAVFPLAYATIMPALYAPLIVMLLALIFRGVAFEFRWRTKRGKFLWDWAFAGGSLIATFSQGVALGALVQGIKVANRAYAGGWWDWLTPFSLLTGVALVVGYALLGSTWLVMKTDTEVRDKARLQARLTGIGTLALIGAVSLWTPFQNAVYLERWFAWPAMLFSGIVPLLVLLCAFLLFKGLAGKRDYVPFLASLGIFVLCYIGIGISFYPYMVPPSLTIWDVAAPDESLGFLLVGTVVLLPMILAYTAYAYWVFRGKVDPSEGYH